MRDALTRWPLLLVGAGLIGWAVQLADTRDPSDARALLFGVGCVTLGAGLTAALRRRRDDDDDYDDW